MPARIFYGFVLEKCGTGMSERMRQIAEVNPEYWEDALWQIREIITRY